MKKTIFVVVIVLLCLLVLEMVLRIIGFGPTVFNQQVQNKPEIPYVIDSLGINLKKGTYHITINNKIKYSATHNEAGRRITSFTPVNGSDKIFILGCSFPYGVGVNDDQTFPFLLQNQFKNYEIQNYAVPGIGTLQAYLNLKKKVENGDIPKMVVLSFATFHEERNQLTRSFESKLVKGLKLHQELAISNYFYPRCTIKNQQIYYEYVDVIKDFISVPFTDNSAIATFIDQMWIAFDYRKTDDFPVSKLLLKDSQKLANHYGFKLIIADVFYNSESNQIATFCAKNGLNYVNISPDFSKGTYTFAPFDYHPNQKAHAIYSQKLYNHINSIK